MLADRYQIGANVSYAGGFVMDWHEYFQHAHSSSSIKTGWGIV
jgi:hypothetical protein